jgi:probable HAF family extracellular repeat protein
MSRRRCILTSLATLVMACGDPLRPANTPLEAPVEVLAARPTNGITIIDLGSISVDAGSNARDVNASGVIVGHAQTRRYEPDLYSHAMRWTVTDAGAVVAEDLMPLLGLPAIADAFAVGVNDVGTVVGLMRKSDQENYQGFVLSASSVVDVSTFPRCDGAPEERNFSAARDINNRQEVVGEVGYTSPSATRGYVFYLDLGAASPCLDPLPGLSTPGAAAYAINDSSVIVGESSEALLNWAVRWRRSGGVWAVSKLGRDSTRAWGINLRGDVAGQFLGPKSYTDQHALYWLSTAGALSEQELGTLGGPSSVANDVDDTGRVVGWAHNKQFNSVAFDWTKTTGMRDLGTLGGKWASANAVNGNRIVGYSSLATPGRTITDHATLWRLP